MDNSDHHICPAECAFDHCSNRCVLFYLLSYSIIEGQCYSDVKFRAVSGLVKCCLDATRRSQNTSEKPQSTTAAQNTNDPHVR